MDGQEESNTILTVVRAIACSIWAKLFCVIFIFFAIAGVIAKIFSSSNSQPSSSSSSSETCTYSADFVLDNNFALIEDTYIV